MTDVATPENGAAKVRRIELDIEGMSCGACARRVENALNKMPGVRASVKFSTKVASIDVDGDISASALREVVEQAGYAAEVRAESASSGTILDVPDQHGPLAGAPAAVRTLLRRISFGHLA
ncbi:heavy-metal-associated domain-containing protein [Candidatus Mycobacterium wuenschmannii]|uniref:heavy-metal-associated domain-containing protein n=1 Tax=Candidatus Mycobacterium wuenschmannii TaxID=3027808 RepID=UPI0036F42C37